MTNMNKEILWKIDDLDEVIQRYPSKIWNRGRSIYQEGSVLDAYATDENTAGFTVKGTVNYTVVIKRNADGVHIDCNCPYFGECKHEAAALCYIKEHPKLKVIDQPITMKMNALDEFKLEVEEQLYEMDEGDEDYTPEERLCSLYAIIKKEDDIETRMAMVYYLWKNYPVDDELWNIVEAHFIQNRQVVVQAIKNSKDESMCCMIEDLISAMKFENQEIYEELVQCLKEKMMELTSYKTNVIRYVTN